MIKQIAGIGLAIVLVGCGQDHEVSEAASQADAAAAEADAAAADAIAAAMEAGAAAGAAPAAELEPEVEASEVQAVALSGEDRGRVCRAAIASIMGRDPNIIRVTSQDGINVRVAYTRDDGTRWAQACRVHDRGYVEWAGIERGQQGRWRNEDDIRFEIRDGDAIHIRQSSMGELIDDDVYEVR